MRRVISTARRALRDFDQLAHERAAGRAFGGFREGAHAFPPTYVM